MQIPWQVSVPVYDPSQVGIVLFRVSGKYVSLAA